MREEPRFDPGELVSHHRYGYRGVVADLDPECRADDAWYRSNATRPDRAQPWYHVLVHGSDATTYVAEENLRAYRGGEQVANPLVRRFFVAFAQGRYQLPGHASGARRGEAADGDASDRDRAE